MMPRLLTNKLFIPIAATALGLVIWIYLVFLPLQARHRSNESEIQTLREESRSAELVLSSAGEVKARASRTSDDLQQFLSSIYDTDNLPRFLKSLELMADQHGLESVVITPEMSDLLQSTTTPFGEAHLRHVALQLSCRGRFLSFGHFVEELHEQPFFVRLNSLNISQSQETDAGLLCSLKFTAYLREAGEADG